MTTSELRSGLRRALTTLANSLPLEDGLPPNPTDDRATPEERLAARLVQRLGIEPPIDASRIAASLATVTEKQFPVAIDGLCRNLKVIGGRPKIWISKSTRGVRRRFTLAHEIGHIVIPWHAGSIVDDLDAPRTGARGLYKQMEAEANRFAAELLMPTAWAKSLAARSEHASAMMRTIVAVADVSYPAAFFRTHKYGPPGYVGAEVQGGIVIRSCRTKGTWSLAPEIGVSVTALAMPVAEDPHIISSDTFDYYWWRMRDRLDAPAEPDAPWRSILDTILASVVPCEQWEQMRSRVNAVIGYAIGRSVRGASVEEIYRNGLEATQNRSDRDGALAGVFAHPDFHAYILARAYDRSRRG